jgi:hypothetical protein
MKRQAEKVNPGLVQLHIKRQRALGERMVGESDRPRLVEFLCAAAVVLLAVAKHQGWL